MGLQSNYMLNYIQITSVNFSLEEFLLTVDTYVITFYINTVYQKNICTFYKVFITQSYIL